MDVQFPLPSKIVRGAVGVVMFQLFTVTLIGTGNYRTGVLAENAVESSIIVKDPGNSELQSLLSILVNILI